MKNYSSLFLLHVAAFFTMSPIAVSAGRPSEAVTLEDTLYVQVQPGKEVVGLPVLLKNGKGCHFDGKAYLDANSGRVRIDVTEKLCGKERPVQISAFVVGADHKHGFDAKCGDRYVNLVGNTICLGATCLPIR